MNCGKKTFYNHNVRTQGKVYMKASVEKLNGRKGLKSQLAKVE
jgi:hypothetical protein